MTPRPINCEPAVHRADRHGHVWVEMLAATVLLMLGTAGAYAMALLAVLFLHGIVRF